MKGAITQLRYQCGESAQWTIGATRCDDQCVNTVLLETQGRVRRCSDDTVTHDTGVQGRCHKTVSATHVAGLGREGSLPTDCGRLPNIYCMPPAPLCIDPTGVPRILTLSKFRTSASRSCASEGHIDARCSFQRADWYSGRVRSGGTHDAHVVEVNEHVLFRIRVLTCLHHGVMDGQLTQKWHHRIPLFAPFSVLHVVSHPC